jgi:hypothetical protein
MAGSGVLSWLVLRRASRFVVDGQLLIVRQELSFTIT